MGCVQLYSESLQKAIQKEQHKCVWRSEIASACLTATTELNFQRCLASSWALVDDLRGGKFGRAQRDYCRLARRRTIFSPELTKATTRYRILVSKPTTAFSRIGRFEGFHQANLVRSRSRSISGCGFTSATQSSGNVLCVRPSGKHTSGRSPS